MRSWKFASAGTGFQGSAKSGKLAPGRCTECLRRPKKRLPCADVLSSSFG